MKRNCRRLVLVFGDQLDADSPVFDQFDPQSDRVWMAEVDEEATYVWSHKVRLVFFFTAMRHFARSLEERGFAVDYHALTGDRRKARGSDFPTILEQALRDHQPERVVFCQPGDYRVDEQVRSCLNRRKQAFEVVPDRHFLCDTASFDAWAEGKKSLVLETFYRWMRKRTGILMDAKNEPLGGQWNFDQENRGSFSKSGPEGVPPLRSFPPDELTRDVIEMVEQRFGDHPGSTEAFDYPVTREQSLEALADFIEHRLRWFGDYQDAMWTGEAFLYHSRLSSVLNVQLLRPQEVIDAALAAHRKERLPLNNVEGFVRQILGWREFVRGIYWRYMPEYLERNALECEDLPVPQAYWNGQSEMNCIRSVMQQVRTTAYAHHIQRLMVLGLFAQIAGVHPKRFHEWHLAMYADAVDWVSLPNALGMSQYGDGGLVGTKPYCASGNYIHKMSNYCDGCRFHYKEATGENACPVTTFYWDFLDRHEARLSDNHRMGFQLKNLRNKSDEDRQAIREQAQEYRERIRQGEPL